jgi:hypothetical protein
MNIEGWKALKVLAVEQETTLNALAVEAFNDLLKKHGKRQSVENPPARLMVPLALHRWLRLDGGRSGEISKMRILGIVALGAALAGLRPVRRISSGAEPGRISSHSTER